MPGIQVVTQQLHYECRINHRCRTEFGNVVALNNILSNILYIVFGALFICFVKYRNVLQCKSFSSAQDRDGMEFIESKVSHAPPPPQTNEKCGVRYDSGIYYAMGLSLFLEGFFSGIYHICPTPTTIQFDFTFIICSVLLLCVALYKKRHTHLAGFENPVQFLGLIATMVAMNGVLQVISGSDGSSGSCALRAVFTCLYVLLVILVGIALRRKWVLTFVFYEPRKKFGILARDLCIWMRGTSGETRNDSNDKKLRAIQDDDDDNDEEDEENVNSRKRRRPTIKDSILDHLKGRILIIVVILNITIAISMNVMCEAKAAGSFEAFSIVCTGMNSAMYFVLYFLQKYLHNERLTRTAWISFISSLTLGIFAIYFFVGLKDYEVFGSAEDNERRAHSCILFDFFGPHDMWHLLSAPSVFFMYIFVLCIDDDLKCVPRRSIPIF